LPRRPYKAGNGAKPGNADQITNGDKDVYLTKIDVNHKSKRKVSENKYRTKFLLDKINIGIIEELVNNGDIKSSEISAKLKIPLSTIQRRRNNLEKLSVLKKNYTVDLKRLNLRIAEIMIGTSNGDSKKVMSEVYNKHKNSIIDMSLRIGNPDTNVSFRLAYRSSRELFEVLEEIKEMDDVKNVSWSEYISEKRNDKSSFDDLLKFT
jgi:DNA-binding Lrp family transcriptional regulator